MSWFSQIFGGGGDVNIDWKQLKELMDYSAQLNRYDDTGIFSGTKWNQDEDGNWSRERVVNDGMQPGVDRLMARGSGGQNMGMPTQMNSLMNSMMMNQMQRREMQGEMNQMPEGYGQGYGQQMQSPYTPAAPPQEQAPARPSYPGDGGNPGGGPAVISPQAAQMAQAGGSIGGPPQGPPQGNGAPQGGQGLTPEQRAAMIRAMGY